jgi:hypothetical protein
MDSVGRRVAEDFATCMRARTDVHYPKEERIRVVPDNLSTYSAGRRETRAHEESRRKRT